MKIIKYLLISKVKKIETKLESIYYERIAKERRENGLIDDLTFKNKNDKKDDKKETPKRIDSADLEAVITSIGINDE